VPRATKRHARYRVANSQDERDKLEPLLSAASIRWGRVQREDVLASVREAYECIGQADRCLHCAAGRGFLTCLTGGAAPFQVGKV
jgi:hypothetical protein